MLKEALRLWSPAPMIFFRSCMKDNKLGDITIKKGAIITTAFLLNNEDSGYFKDPESFIPERW